MNDRLTPVELMQQLSAHMSEDQAADIAEKVYQPLMQRLDFLERRINSLDNRTFGSVMYGAIE